MEWSRWIRHGLRSHPGRCKCEDDTDHRHVWIVQGVLLRRSRQQRLWGAFTPNPGDKIFSQEWYCDSKGNPDLNGGYGCTYLMNEKSGAILNCTLAGFRSAR